MAARVDGCGMAGVLFTHMALSLPLNTTDTRNVDDRCGMVYSSCKACIQVLGAFFEQRQECHSPEEDGGNIDLKVLYISWLRISKWKKFYSEKISPSLKIFVLEYSLAEILLLRRFEVIENYGKRSNLTSTALVSA